MSDASICLVILVAVIALFIWNRLPVEIVAVGSAMALFATGLLPADQIFAGFGDPVIAFIAGLFIVSEGLNASGITAWAGQFLVSRAGTGRRRLLVATMLLAGVLTALISVNGATAALLPMVVLLAVRLGRSPSELAMPLAFAGHAGSLLLLTATPINVLVSDAAADAGGRPFGFFEFALVGVPLLAGTIAIAILAGDRLLPKRTPRSLPADLSGHARTLIEHYRLDAHAAGLTVPRLSATVGHRSSSLATPDTVGPVVIGALAADHRTSRGDEPLQPDDVVVVHGADTSVDRFAAAHDLRLLPRDASDKLARLLLNRDLGAAEVVLSPRSALIGDTVWPGMTTDGGELVILAVHRKGQHLGPEPMTLAAGDALLVRGSWPALERHAALTRDLLVVDDPATVRRQAITFGPGAAAATAILVGMISLLAFGVVPPAVAAMLAAGAMIVCRVLTMTKAYDGISFTTIVIVAGMFPLSVAMQQSGAADQLAHLVVSTFGGNGQLLLLGLFLLTAALGQVISNTATALIVIPIAASAAADVGVSVQPVMMCVCIAAAAAFLTPIATAANLMVKEPGGYRFGDYWKFGLPLLVWFMAVAVLLVPLIWGL